MLKQTKEEYIKTVVQFYKERELEIPQTVDLALKGSKPKYFTYKSVKKYFGCNLLEILDAVHIAAGVVKHPSKTRGKTVTHETKCNDCNLTLNGTERKNNATLIKYTCNKCGTSHVVQGATLRKWWDSNTKNCPDCRGSIKGRSDEARMALFSEKLKFPYSRFVKPHSLLKTYKSHGRVLLEFSCCGAKKEYNTSSLTQIVKEGGALSCDNCTYETSAMEHYVEDLILHLAPDLIVDKQVPYDAVKDCDRSWRVDFLINRSILVEVTTGLTDKAEYSENLENKRVWCEEHGVSLYIITSLHEVEDIVRSISKEVEG